MDELADLKKRIYTAVGDFERKAGDCHDKQSFFDTDVESLMWFDHEDGCEKIDTKSATILAFACRNYGYFSIEVDFKLEAQDSVVTFTPPVQGKLRVRAPHGGKKYNFDWNFSNVTANVSSRKESCYIIWSLYRNRDQQSVTTRINVMTVDTPENHANDSYISS